MKMNGSEQTDSDSEPAPLLAIMGRFYPFDEDGIEFANTTLVIKEMQNQSNGGGDGGTAFNVWDGSLLLARYLEKSPDLVKDKTVLELGSGCGLVGIASAILGAKEVTMTDLRYAIPLMQDNVKRNEPSWKSEGMSCQQINCKECDWFRPPPIAELCDNADGADVILVADCVWLAPLISPLLQTLKSYTTNNASTKIIITYQQRGKDAHDEFWEGIHELFHVDIVDTEKRVGLAKPDVFHVLECSKKN